VNNVRDQPLIRLLIDRLRRAGAPLSSKRGEMTLASQWCSFPRASTVVAWTFSRVGNTTSPLTDASSSTRCWTTRR